MVIIIPGASIATRRIRCGIRLWASLMVARNRLLPGSGPNDRAVPQQRAGVLVKKGLRIARHIEASAPGEHMVLHRLDVFRVPLHAGELGMRIVDVIGELFRVIESSP